MRSSAGIRTRVAFAAAAAVPAVVLLTTLGLVAALVVPFVVSGHGAPVGLVVVPVLLATWRVLAPRRDTTTPPSPRRVRAPEAIAALAPGEPVWLTADRDVVATADGVLVGAFAAAECSPTALRDAVVSALRDRADTSAHRLRRLHATFVSRARMAAEEHPLATLPWGWFARLADAACARALADRRAPTGRAELVAAFEHYWQSYLTPCLEAGYRPPLFAPWRIPESLLPEGSDALENELLGAGPLVPLPWERFADAVLLPYARDVAGRASLHAQTIAELAALSRDAEDDPERLFALSCALVVALADAGWEIVAVPGDPVRALSEDASLLPFDVPYALAGDRRASWGEFVAAEGIAHLRLDPIRPFDPQAIELETLLAAPPGAPPGTSVELTLAGPRSHRVRAALVAIVTATLGAPLVAVVLAMPFGVSAPPWAKVCIGAAGLALAALLAGWTRSRIRMARATGRLVVDGERLLVEHPVLLRRPFELPRTSLRAVGLDSGPARRDELARRVALPVAAPPWEGAGALGFLWTDGIGSMVPLLAVQPCLPNVALVFSHRVPAPDVRHRRTRGPRRRDGIGGLLLCATAIPPEAQATLARLGLSTQLTRDDALHLQDA